MSKKGKPIVTVILTFALVCSLILSGYADQEEGPVATFEYEGEYYPFDTLEEAFEAAVELEVDTVYLTANYKAVGTDGVLNIPSTITLVIPTSTDYAADLNTKGAKYYNGAAPAEGKAFATLTIPTGLTLEVDGTLIVAGNQQSQVPRTGFLSGDYGALNLDGGKMTVNGTLYARGRVYGSGEINVADTGTVYQRFQIADWRGGTQSLRAYNRRVFPFNLYSLGGIESTTIYKGGAVLNGQAYIYAASQEIPVEIPYIAEVGSSSGCIYNISGTGDITFTYGANNVQTFTLNNCTIQTGSLKLNALIYEFDSADLYCPFGYNTKAVINSGATMNIANKYKCLPGFSLDVLGTLNILSNGEMFFYTADMYLAKYNNAGWTNSSSATLSKGENGVINVEGVIGSTATDFSNILAAGVTGNGTQRIGEYEQGSLAILPDYVTFETYSPTATTAE